MKKLKPIHKFNGGLGATLCNHCHVIITTGMTEDIFCKSCGPNKVTLHNRHRDKIIFEHIGDEVIMTGGQWLRYGFSNEDNSITMVDPSGGPYIEIKDNLNDFWPRGTYQDLFIESISFREESNEGNSSTVVFKIKNEQKGLHKKRGSRNNLSTKRKKDI